MVYVSNLLTGIEEIQALKAFALLHKIGVECVIFTDNEDYKQQMETFLQNKGDLPITFHGPYSSVEATSKKGTPEYDFLVDSYRYTFELAHEYGAKHIVFHYSQKAVAGDLATAQHTSKQNIAVLLEMAEKKGVQLLIENLAAPFIGQALYSFDEYCSLFETFPQAGCILDLGHLHIKKWPLETAINTIGAGRIKAYHLHNNDGIGDTHRRLLDGSADMRKQLELVRKCTPEAAMVIEYEPGTASLSELLEDVNMVRIGEGTQ